MFSKNLIGKYSVNIFLSLKNIDKNTSLE